MIEEQVYRELLERWYQITGRHRNLFQSITDSKCVVNRKGQFKPVTKAASTLYHKIVFAGMKRMVGADPFDAFYTAIDSHAYRNGHYLNIYRDMPKASTDNSLFDKVHEITTNDMVVLASFVDDTIALMEETHRVTGTVASEKGKVSRMFRKALVDANNARLAQ